MSYAATYQKVFDYLRSPAFPPSPEGVLAFGRQDPLVAAKIAGMSHNGLAKFVVISGGTGKDSGSLTMPEATYLDKGVHDIARRKGILLPPIYTETAARNGSENVRNGLALMRREGLPHNSGLTALAHPTSLRRLAAQVEHETAKLGDPVATVHRVPTDYHFQPDNPADQAEAFAELQRLIEWPTHQTTNGQPDPWLGPQDVPAEFVDFYHDQKQGNP